MRINSKMIAKDLRLSGYIFKLFSIKNFKKAKFKNIKERKNLPHAAGGTGRCPYEVVHLAKRDYYEVLGVDKNADEATLKKA